MKNHTDAYYRLRRQADDLFNFVVTVCYSMPLLRKTVSEIKGNKSAKSLLVPDYFVHDNRSPEMIEKQGIANYELRLSSYVVLSSFSFFEDYVVSAIQEIIDFHGGNDKFADLATRRIELFMLPPSEEVKEHKRKLQEPIKGSKKEKYEKHSRALLELGYKFPTELLSAYGVRCLIQKANNLRAVEIPDLLRNCFGMKLEEKDLEPFHMIRERRNQIAHGTRVTLSLRKAIEMNTYLHDLATKIDQHLIEYFYVIESFT